MHRAEMNTTGVTSSLQGLVSRVSLRPRIGRESRNRTLQVVTRAGAS